MNKLPYAPIGESQVRSGARTAADQAAGEVLAEHTPGPGWYHVIIRTYFGPDSTIESRPSLLKLRVDSTDRGFLPADPFEVGQMEMLVKLRNRIDVVQNEADADLVTVSATIVLTPITKPCGCGG